MDHTTANEGVEPEGLPAVQILGFVFATVVFIAVLVVVGVELALHEFDTAEVAAIETTGYPIKRETNAAAQALLYQGGVVDADAGIVRIPIDRAMADMVMTSAPGTTEEVTLTR
ncbi:MAG: hypothetical protein HKN29_00865 [Rhodothermales bacterium]|nr:hypothetical protein [Rhodothermales bacterium]